MNDQPKNVARTGIVTGVAAILANVVEQVLHPFEVLKLRFQSHDGQYKRNLVPKYKNIFQGLVQIATEEGIRGLYRGVVLSGISSNIAKFLFFGLFGMEKERYEQIFGRNSQKAIFFSSIEASVMATVLTSPLWVIKTRVLLNTTNERNGFRNLVFTVSEVYRQHGSYGFFRGLPLSLALSTHGLLQMALYENFKLLANYGDSSSIFTPAACGTASKCITSLFLYPMNVIRTRIQQNQYVESTDVKYKGIIDCAMKMKELEGFRGFYKGFIASTMRVLPSNAIFFFGFEYFKKTFHRLGYYD